MVIKCPEGWTGYSESLSCYKYTRHIYIIDSGTFSLIRFISGDDEKQTWSGAQQSCHDEDSEMLIIDQTNERDWVATRSGYSVSDLLLSTLLYVESGNMATILPFGWVLSIQTEENGTGLMDMKWTYPSRMQLKMTLTPS